MKQLSLDELARKRRRSWVPLLFVLVLLLFLWLRQPDEPAGQAIEPPATESSSERQPQ